MVYGGRVSMSVGIVAVSISVTLGVLLGGLFGFYGGRVDNWIMRFTEVVMAFPTLIILITIVSILGPGLYNLMIAIGLISWTGIARLVRGQILSLREMDFVLAARAVGVPQRCILVQHVLPNVWTLDNGSKSCEQVIVNLHGGLNTIQDCSHMCIREISA